MRAVVVGALDQQPRVDQPVDQAARRGRQVVERRAAGEDAALLVEPHQAGRERLAQRVELRLGRAANRFLGAAPHRRFERRQIVEPHRLVMRLLETTRLAAIALAELAQHEGDQRQRVLGRRVGADRLDQLFLDHDVDPLRRAPDDLAEPVERHRLHREEFQRVGQAGDPLRALDVVGAHAQQQPRRVVAGDQRRQQRKERLALLGRRSERLLGLVDRQDEDRLRRAGLHP